MLPGGLLALAIILGLTWNPSGGQADWIFKIGTLGATVAPLGLCGIYTVTGNKWWTNTLGTALIQSLLSIVVIAAPLAWAIWKDHGMITGGLCAWLEVAGPLLAAVTITRLCVVFASTHRASAAEQQARHAALAARQAPEGDTPPVT
jgi:hypothetical protein